MAITDSDAFVASEGKVTFAGSEVHDAREINVTWTRNVAQYRSSSTKGLTKVRQGSEHVTGSFTVYVPEAEAGAGSTGAKPAALTFDEDAVGNLKLESKDGSQTLFDDEAVITEVEYTATVEDEAALVGATVTFERNATSNTTSLSFGDAT